MFSSTLEYCEKRIRTDCRTSPLTTLTMQAIKLQLSPSLYKQSIKRAKILKLKNQKTFELIAFRLSFLSFNLCEKNRELTYPQCANKICEFLHQGLDQQIKASFDRQTQNNPIELLEMTSGVVSEDIELIRKILSTNPEDESMIQQLVSEYYSKDPSKTKFIKKVTKLFCLERMKPNNNGYDSTMAQSVEMGNVEQVSQISACIESDVDEIINEYYQQDNFLKWTMTFERN